MAAVLPQTVEVGAGNLENGDGVNWITIVTGATLGTYINRLSISSDDVERIMQIGIEIGAVTYIIGQVTVAATTYGQNGLDTTAILFLAATEKPIIHLESGHLLKVKVTVAVTAAKIIDIVAMGAHY